MRAVDAAVHVAEPRREPGGNPGGYSGTRTCPNAILPSEARRRVLHGGKGRAERRGKGWKNAAA